MDPQVWGKYQWTAIHFAALGYPKSPTEAQKQYYFTYFTKILPEVLPCLKCRQHLKQTLQTEHPMNSSALANPDTLFEWTVSLHNVVNRRLEKPTLSLEEARNIYMYRDNLHRALCENVPASQLDHTHTTDSTVDDLYVANDTRGRVCIPLPVPCVSTLGVAGVLLLTVLVCVLVYVYKLDILGLIRAPRIRA